METITSYLAEDHRHADRLFAAAAEHASKREWRESTQKLAEFRAALTSHMKLEEDVLFPAFEQVMGSDAGPTAVMRSEHRDMLEQLDAIAAALDASDGNRSDTLMRSFLASLDMHSMKEENVLYPMCDRMVGMLNANELRKKLEQIRAQG